MAQLDWKFVELGPERALSMQTAAVSLALRAAVRNVEHALERVEGKLDQLLELVRAERLGNVAGDRRTLEALVLEVRERGRISATDWSTVDMLGALIARDIEGLRAYITRQVEAASSEDRRRSAALADLADDLIGESLALLAAAEYNLLLWHELKLARDVTAIDEMAAAVDDTSSRLNALATEDQELADQVSSVAAELMEPTGWEGLRPGQRRSLAEAGAAIADSLEWFTIQRNLDLSLERVEYPNTRDSVAKAAGIVRAKVDDAREAVRSRRSDEG